MPRPRPHWTLQRLRRHPAALLLIVQLLGIFLYPMLGDNRAGRTIVAVFGIVVVALVVLVIRRSSAESLFAWVLAVPSVCLSLVVAFVPMPHLQPIANLLESLLYFYAAVGLIFYMLGDHRVTTDELIGAASTFTLLAWGFAYAFAVCQAWDAGAFSGVGAAHQPHSWLELLYLSFSMLSGVGLSDITPLSPSARALSMLAMFCGVMYIAIVVSRLIALTVVRQQQR